MVLQKVVFTNKLPTMKGNIAPRCWKVFLDITQRCSKLEANKRPTMNEVKTQLQHALALQEEADAKTGGKYGLLSATFDALIGRCLCWEHSEL